MIGSFTLMRLGEICSIINGRNQKKVEDINGKYPIYGSGGIMGYANDYICKAGTTIIGRKGSINKPLYVDKDFWNVDTAFGLQPKECCNSRFLYYLCKSIDFTRYDKGVTIPSLVKSDLLQIPVSIPTLEEQARIVEELDQLSNIIEKKRQQLSELDNLAQSIFYDMFGDPVTNEKGWEVKRIGEFASVKIGPFGSLLHNSDYIVGGTPLVNPIHMRDEVIHCEQNFTVSDEKLKELASYLLKTDDIIMARRGDIGRCALVKETENGYICGTGSLFVRLKKKCTPLFLIKVIRTMPMIEYLTSKAKGATMLNINCKIVENLPIPLPPLQLQQLFAQKIEAIEKEKELIKQSIKETEELFNSRMDYYFG